MKNRMTTFYIVRHGETDWNVQKRIQGQTDIPLNKNGQDQAKQIAKSFSKLNFDLAFSSDLLRAKATADIIAAEHKLVVEMTHVLRERKFGDLEGKPHVELHDYMNMLKKLTHEQRAKEKQNDDYENDENLTQRLFTFLREAAVAYPGKKILIAAHGGTLRMILLHLGYLTYQQSDETSIANTGYVKLTSDGIDFFVDEVRGLFEREDITPGL